MEFSILEFFEWEITSTRWPLTYAVFDFSGFFESREISNFKEKNQCSANHKNRMWIAANFWCCDSCDSHANLRIATLRLCESQNRIVCDSAILQNRRIAQYAILRFIWIAESHNLRFCDSQESQNRTICDSCDSQESQNRNSLKHAAIHVRFLWIAEHW